MYCIFSLFYYYYFLTLNDGLLRLIILNRSTDIAMFKFKIIEEHYMYSGAIDRRIYYATTG